MCAHQQHCYPSPTPTSPASLPAPVRLSVSEWLLSVRINLQPSVLDLLLTLALSPWTRVWLFPGCSNAGSRQGFFLQPPWIFAFLYRSRRLWLDSDNFTHSEIISIRRFPGLCLVLSLNMALLQVMENEPESSLLSSGPNCKTHFFLFHKKTFA